MSKFVRGCRCSVGVVRMKGVGATLATFPRWERQSFIDNLLVRIHFIIVMIW
jgi:hypothetical protein